MSDVSTFAAELKQTWLNVRSGLDANRSAWKASSPHVSLEQLDEVIATLASWLERVKAPKGFKPGFAVSRALALSSLPAAISACQGLGRAEYGQFNPLISALTQSVTALHGMTLFAGRSAAGTVAAELSSNLAESLALTETAQKEIASKQERLKGAELAAVTVEKAAAAIESTKTRAAEIVRELSETSQASIAASAALKAREDGLVELEEQHEELAKQSTALVTKLDDALDRAGRLQEEAERQSEVIAALLPKGASAGLAASFADRVRALEFTKWMWMSLFGVAIGGLIWVGMQVFGAPVPDGSTLLAEFAKRLPLLGPMIWLGWFSAIQYGNVLRVQEDYAFKEASSKAFAGYRDYLETMQAIQVSEGRSALSLLAASTIEILAREPLRILEKSAQDVSPTQAVVKAMTPGVSAGD